MKKTPDQQRRRFLQGMSLIGFGSLAPTTLLASTATPVTHAIPKSGEQLPAIGMGSWLTFAVGDNPNDIAARVKVLQIFFEMGGKLVDSSPMYGSSEEVIGECLVRIKPGKKLFSATKVWTTGWQQGVRQMKQSQQKWGIERFDLMQIHNLLDWETHIETLKAWKAEGRIRYIGITTSHGRRHDELAEIMQSEPALDFVQFTYNIEDREAEQHLLPIARERKLAVIINRPFQRGGLFENTLGRPLPPWASEIDCENWAQFFLKFVISHPAVTCAIPATSRVDHMRENMAAMQGRLPDATIRKQMVAWYKKVS